MVRHKDVSGSLGCRVEYAFQVHPVFALVSLDGDGVSCDGDDANCTWPDA